MTQSRFVGVLDVKLVLRASEAAEGTVAECGYKAPSTLEATGVATRTNGARSHSVACCVMPCLACGM